VFPRLRQVAYSLVMDGSQHGCWLNQEMYEIRSNSGLTASNDVRLIVTLAFWKLHSHGPRGFSYDTIPTLAICSARSVLEASKSGSAGFLRTSNWTSGYIRSVSAQIPYLWHIMCYIPDPIAIAENLRWSKAGSLRCTKTSHEEDIIITE